MKLKPLTTEKAIMKIETINTLVFVTDLNSSKEMVKNEIEKLFKVKVDSVKSLIKNNKKYAYVKLNKSNLAIDVATKLGLI
jgi:large subunit ribosomal protein L23Ae